MIVVTTNQRVGVLSDGHRTRWGAERVRKYVARIQGAGPHPCDMRVVKERNRWAVVCFQNYATDSEDMASWIRALDVELSAGDLTAAQFVTEVRRYSEMLNASVI